MIGGDKDSWSPATVRSVYMGSTELESSQVVEKRQTLRVVSIASGAESSNQVRFMVAVIYGLA